MAAEAQSGTLNFDPNGPGMGLDLDFNKFDIDNIDAIQFNVDCDIANFGFNNLNNDFDNFDLGGFDIENGANFNFEGALKEAELSLGPRETLQEANTSLSSLSNLPPLKLTNEKSGALTLTEASNLGTSTLERQEPVHSNEMRAQKRKKMDEVDEGHILPEGSRRNRNKTARARGIDSLA